MRRRVVTVLVTAFAAAAMSGTAVSQARVTGPDVVALHRAMAGVIAAGATGVQVRVDGPWGSWVATAGSARRDDPAPVPADGMFRVGSITKTFVATVVLQLVAEAAIGLDDPVADHLPGFDLDERITIGDILGHTSGLRGYAGEPGPNGESSPSALALDLRRTYRPDDLVRFALAQPAWFAPGTRWHYSNTNYLLAGLLIEQVTATPYAHQIESRILEPLALTATRLPGTSPTIPGPHAHGYLGTEILGRPIALDVTELDPSMAGAAGEIISTTADLNRFLDALVTGRLLPPALFARMRDVRPAGTRSGMSRGYGLGLVELSDSSGCSGIGHSGDIPGYHSQSYATTSPENGRRVTVSVTQGAIDSSDRPRFAAYLDAAAAITAIGLCDTPG